MSTQHPFRFSTGVIGYPIAFVLLIWIVFWVEVRFGYRFNTLGVFPRTISGLRGIIFSPFIHSSLEHLYHNSTPLLVLSTALFYFYRSIAWKVILLGILFSGLFTWSIGSSGYHIGAIGLIYVLMSFILFKGLFSKNFRLIHDGRVLLIFLKEKLNLIILQSRLELKLKNLIRTKIIQSEI